MNYWHMQLHPEEYQDWAIEDIKTILSNSMIGCSGEPVHEFYKIQMADIILVRHGGKVIALVEAIERPRETQLGEKNQYIWFDHCLKVKVLQYYENISVSGYGWYLPKTLMRIKESNTIARNFIIGLYKNYMDEKMKSDILALLNIKNQIILHGPPGTGKTRMAKEIAKEIVSDSARQLITDSFMQTHITIGLKLWTPDRYNTFQIQEIKKNSIKIYPRDAKNSYTINYSHIKDCCNQWRSGESITKYNNSGIGSYIVSISKFLLEKASEECYSLVQFHPAYTYEDFVRGIKVDTKDDKVTYISENRIIGKIAHDASQDRDNNYVLIIDEINRANLPAVLGELIYALEYRDIPVKSMYSITGNYNLVLPSNLYIIGTMNTADRSVGHIDYAIRRRFAFKEVLPDESVITYDKSKALYKKVKEIFIDENSKHKHLASDFRWQDVLPGHSYFLETDPAKLNLRLEYEIRPLLKEYVKDGILLPEAEKLINELQLNGIN